MRCEGIDVPADQREGQSFRFLLVDDDPRMLSSLCDLLQDKDYCLITANCGNDAIAQLLKVKFDLFS